MFDDVRFLWTILVIRVQAARDDDTGASALEWAIIAAVSVVMATIIGTIIYNIVNNKSKAIDKCGNTPVGGNC